MAVRDDLPPFAEWLQREFEYKTQREVAHALGISYAYAHDLGYGRRRLNVALAMRVQRAYPKFPARKILRLELDYDLERAGG